MEVDVLGPLVDPQITALADQVEEQAKGAGGGGEDENQSQATLAANMAADWDLWHTPAKDAYATFPVGEHLETWPVRSKMFKRFLAKQFFEECGKAMNAEALGAAVNLIEAQALFDGRSTRSTFGSPNTMAMSISTCATPIGRRSKFRPTAGRSSPSRRSSSGGRRECSRCRRLSPAARFGSFAPS